MEELIHEVNDCRWDALLLSETWRPNEAGSRNKTHQYGCWKIRKHGVAVLLNKKWRKKINWTEYINERAIATPITVSKQRITLMSVYIPTVHSHSGYADQHFEKVYNSIVKITISMKRCKCGRLHAELGTGSGIERLSVGMYTFNESKSRGDWLKQWLVSQKFVVLNTMCKNT